MDEEAGRLLDEQSGIRTSGRLSPENNVKESTGWAGGSKADQVKNTFEANSGGASRFFYCAKTSKKERTCHGNAENKHPTVKPIALMRYLVRLVTPPNGVVLDPFMGSGSTGIACILENMHFFGIDSDKESVKTAEQRITHSDCFGD